jgi:iron complex outermembrane receptor protein
MFIAPAQAQEAEQPAAAAPAAAEHEGGIADIIVTARRRSESLLETPVAVTAFSADELSRRQITQLSEIQKSTPSLTYEATGGNSSDARIFIRGVGNNFASSSFGAGVGLYIDGAYFPRAQGALLDNLDIGSLEVLRGPQGTLFGKNTIGGALNITTARPNTDAFSGSFEAGYGRFDKVRVRGSINIPLSETLAVRIAGLVDRDDGYSVNDVNGQKLDNTNRRMVSGSIRFTPTENLTWDFSAFYSKDRSNGRGYRCNATGDTPLGDIYVDACAASNANGIRHVRSDLIQLSPTEMFAASSQLAWNIGEIGFIDDLTIKGIGAFQHIDSSNAVQEFDGTDLDALVGKQFGYKTGQYSGEVQILGEAFDRKLNFVFGAYADREFTPGNWETRGGRVFPFLEDFGIAASFVQRLQLKPTSRALYTQFTYDFNKIVSVTGGLRYTKDRAGFYAQKFHVLADDPTQTPVGGYLTDGLFLRNFSNWTPMGSLQLNAPEAWTGSGFLDQGMLYFTYSKGYKSGGFNGSGEVVNGTLTTFRPEKVDNYEVGVKFSMFDRRLVGSLTRYQMDYKDIQFSVSGLAPGGLIVASTFNAGAAKVKGIEVELQAMPVESLRISLNGDFNSAHYTRFDDASVPGGSRVGEPFAMMPDYRVSGSIENRFALGGELALTPRVQVTRTGERYFLQDPSQVVRDIAYIGPLTLVDASVRLDVNEQLAFDVFGKNIFNKKYKNDVQTVGFVTLEYFGAPVTWGVNARFKF